MIQHFSYSPSASNARKLVRVSAINTRVVVSDEVRAMAEGAIVSEQQLRADFIVDPRCQSLVQELLDLDLRSSIACNSRSTKWVEPVLAAIKYRGGIQHIILGGDANFCHATTTTILQALPEVKVYNLKVIDHVLMDELIKKKESVLLLYTNHSGHVSELPHDAYLFHQTIFVGPSRLAYAVQMYPNFYPLSVILAESSIELTRRGFSPKIADVAFLFNVSVSLDN